MCADRCVGKYIDVSIAQLLFHVFPTSLKFPPMVRSLVNMVLDHFLVFWFIVFIKATNKVGEVMQKVQQGAPTQ